MDLNLTLLGQMLTFAVFVWFTMKYVWPPITKAMNDRQKKIADGIAAGEQGQRELELAHRKSVEILHDSKAKASNIIEEANKRANQIIEEAKEEARVDGKRIVDQAKEQVQQEVNLAKEQLRTQVSGIAIDMAEKILKRTIDANAHKDLLNNLVEEI